MLTLSYGYYCMKLILLNRLNLPLSVVVVVVVVTYFSKWRLREAGKRNL